VVGANVSPCLFLYFFLNKRPNQWAKLIPHLILS
jgi:hypothetical protein